MIDMSDTPQIKEYSVGKMTVVETLPPIYEDILNGGMRQSPYAFYTYGDKIFNPSGQPIPADIIAHEEVHMAQQEKVGIEYWWSRYIDDQYFRIEQEVEAYAVQYRFMCNIRKDRNMRSKILMNFAGILASPTYGSVISTMAAYKMIKNKANVK